ncbi:hypothetical protein NMY22_g19541 [Coprinellus aureogranulatus]|nr:hypothetical protein NMY22_g19541 [Coprinellus aureogranulatus]
MQLIVRPNSGDAICRIHNSLLRDLPRSRVEETSGEVVVDAVEDGLGATAEVEVARGRQKFYQPNEDESCSRFLHARYALLSLESDSSAGVRAPVDPTQRLATCSALKTCPALVPEFYTSRSTSEIRPHLTTFSTPEGTNTPLDGFNGVTADEFAEAPSTPGGEGQTQKDGSRTKLLQYSPTADPIQPKGPFPCIPRAGGHTGAYVRSICLREEGSKPGSYPKQSNAHLCRLLPHMDDYISGADEPANGSGVCKWRRTRSIVARPERMSLDCILVVPICFLYQFLICTTHFLMAPPLDTVIGKPVLVRPESHA